MPRCTHCGKVNREGSLFCQDCGHKIEGAGGSRSQATAGPICSGCGTTNPPGMNFCKMCGTSLVQKSVPLAAEVLASASTVAAPVAASLSKLICPSCSKATPVGFAFCQHCGQRISAAPPSIEGRNSSGAGRAVAPTPPAGLPRATSTSKSADAPASNSTSNGRGAPKSAAEARFGILVSVNRDGSDGARVVIDEEQFDIGRSEGALLFASDPHLGSRHARCLAKGGKILLYPLDTVNGVYLRVQSEGRDLNPGDQFLIGKELLRFEALLPEERDPPQLVEHGVRLYGTFPREAWGRLRQMTIAGTSRDIWHLVRPELVLGREEGDVTFPDDEFMSRRHAAIKRVGLKVRLEDLDSSNGTYLRVRSEHELKPGDMLRLGDQLLRFES